MADRKVITVENRFKEVTTIIVKVDRATTQITKDTRFKNNGKVLHEKTVKVNGQKISYEWRLCTDRAGIQVPNNRARRNF